MACLHYVHIFLVMTRIKKIEKINRVLTDISCVFMHFIHVRKIEGVFS